MLVSLKRSLNIKWLLWPWHSYLEMVARHSVMRMSGGWACGWCWMVWVSPSSSYWRLVTSSVSTPYPDLPVVIYKKILNWMCFFQTMTKSKSYFQNKVHGQGHTWFMLNFCTVTEIPWLFQNLFMTHATIFQTNKKNNAWITMTIPNTQLLLDYSFLILSLVILYIWANDVPFC